MISSKIGWMLDVYVRDRREKIIWERLSYDIITRHISKAAKCKPINRVCFSSAVKKCTKIFNMSISTWEFWK